MVKTVGAERLAWDSDFWGIRVARAYDGAHTPDADCTYLLVDAADTSEIRVAEDMGYRYTDTRVTLTRRTEPHETAATPATDTDLPTLEQIAGSSHRITRFYNDPRFPNQRCDDLYRAWIRNSYRNHYVFVRRDENLTPTGYVTVETDQPVARLGLIAVAEDARGFRIGRSLVRCAVSAAYHATCQEITVATQIANVAALRLFESCGFRVSETAVWMHRWADA